jgi:hypothetical protein
MKKNELILQTNGHAEAVGKPVAKTRLEKLNELQKEISLLQQQELTTIVKKKRGRKPKNALTPTTTQPTQPTQQETIQARVRNFPTLLLLKEKSAAVRKRIELEKLKQTHAHTLRTKQKEIAKLQHTIADNKRSLKRTFATSKLLQIVEPTLQRSQNPILAIQYLYQYLKEKRQYNQLVREIDTIPLVPQLEHTQNETRIENDPTRKYKIDFMTTHKKYLEVGDKYVRLYYLADLPHILHQTVYFKLMAFGLPFQFSVFIKPAQRSVLLKQIRSRISSLQAKQTERLKKGLIRDPEEDKSIEEAETFSQ